MYQYQLLRVVLKLHWIRFVDMKKDFVVWLSISVLPIFIAFLLWNLGIITIGPLIFYGLVEWLILRPIVNVWRLRKLGLTNRFSYWQKLNLSITHRKYLWNVG